jgi:hypothetical protein
MEQWIHMAFIKFWSYHNKDYKFYVLTARAHTHTHTHPHILLHTIQIFETSRPVYRTVEWKNLMQCLMERWEICISTWLKMQKRKIPEVYIQVLIIQCNHRFLISNNVATTERHFLKLVTHSQVCKFYFHSVCDLYVAQGRDSSVVFYITPM